MLTKDKLLALDRLNGAMLAFAGMLSDRLEELRQSDLVKELIEAMRTVDIFPEDYRKTKPIYIRVFSMIRKSQVMDRRPLMHVARSNI